MATVAEAVERITEATGLPEARVSYAARHLRNAGMDLWPTGGKGGGKNAAHVEVHHLVNLLLGVLTAEVLTEAPDLVRQYRDLMPIYTTTTETSTTEVGERVQKTGNWICWTPEPDHADLCYFRKLSLGAVLERIVDQLAAEETALPFTLESLTVIRGQTHAVIRYVNAANCFVEITYFSAQPSLPLTEAGANATQLCKAIAQLRIPAIVPAQIFPILAELVRDTRSRRGGKLPLDESGPETSTPSQGGTGTAHDEVSQPHANAGPGGTAGNTEKGSGNRGEKQSLSTSGHGSPPRVVAQHSRSEPGWPKLNSWMPAAG